MSLPYKHCPCGRVIDDAQTHCSDECADTPALKERILFLERQLAELREERRKDRSAMEYAVGILRGMPAFSAIALEATLQARLDARLRDKSDR